MGKARIGALQLIAFKSFENEELPIGQVMLLTGRNSSGKSNALDGLEVLSRLAGGETLSDALDGRRREGGPVRGGSAGCAPHGTSSFTLGCTVLDDRPDETYSYEYEICVEVSPDVRVVRESLRGWAQTNRGAWIQKALYESTEAEAGGIVARVHNGKQGLDPAESFRDSRPVLVQLVNRLKPRTKGHDSVLAALDAVIAALRGVFQFDPIPHLMRGYVPERDNELRRTGENLSAAVKHLRSEHAAFARLTELVRSVADSETLQLETISSNLGDVMLALQEGPAKAALTPAREMSDGMLRFTAIAVALLSANRGLDIDPGNVATDMSSSVLIVIEEVENGLHPSQAQRVLQLVMETTDSLGSQILMTSHSPALLDAVEGKLNNDVIVCYRDSAGRSRLSRLTELPGYAQAMASGSLGSLVTRDRMTGPEATNMDFTEFDKLIGLR